MTLLTFALVEALCLARVAKESNGVGFVEGAFQTASKTLGDGLMTIEDVESGPSYLFRRMQQISMASFTEECGHFDLTCLQFSALARISERPGIDVTRLSVIMEFDRATLGGVIERLEAKGYITRCSTPEDKRIKLLEITRQGRKLLKEMLPAVERSQARLLRSLSASEQELVLQLLTRLVEFNAEVGRVSSPAKPQSPNVVTLRRHSNGMINPKTRKKAASL